MFDVHLLFLLLSWMNESGTAERLLNMCTVIYWVLPMGQGVVGWSTFPSLAWVINCVRQQCEQEQCVCPINYFVSLICGDDRKLPVNSVIYIGCLSMTKMCTMQCFDLGSLRTLAWVIEWSYQWYKNTLETAQVCEVILVKNCVKKILYIFTYIYIYWYIVFVGIILIWLLSVVDVLGKGA